MTATERRFYDYAVSCARYRDRVYFGADGKAAAELGVSRRTIIRCRQSLEAQGWLERTGVHRWPGKTTVCYRFPRRRVTQRTSYRTTSRTRTRNYVPCSSAKAPRRWRRMTEGQRLVAFYVDECLEQGRPEMVRMKGHMARRAKELLEDAPLAEVQAALREFVRRRCKSPMQLAELSVELVRDQSADAAERPAARRAANEWIKENGWPTGARFVRGTHSGTHIYDPLGTERPPDDWPHRKPTFDDIVVALA